MRISAFCRFAMHFFYCVSVYVCWTNPWVCCDEVCVVFGIIFFCVQNHTVFPRSFRLLYTCFRLCISFDILWKRLFYTTGIELLLYEFNILLYFHVIFYEAVDFGLCVNGCGVVSSTQLLPNGRV